MIMAAEMTQHPSPTLPATRTALELGEVLGAVVPLAVWLASPNENVAEPWFVAPASVVGDAGSDAAAVAVTMRVFVDVQPGISVPDGISVIVSLVALSFA